MKKILLRIFNNFPAGFRTFIRQNILQVRTIARWQKLGCPIPAPDYVKQAIISQYQQKSGYLTFIETGTYQGDMIEAQRTHFLQIHSVELSPKLYQRAVKRFRRFSHIKIWEGDSGIILPKILQNCQEPAIFWLDAHYSGGITARGNQDCPIYEELRAIFDNYPLPHILLIDDARDFGSDPAYPSLAELGDFLHQHQPDYTIVVKDDIIRVEIA
jgi:hypothetical protein